jgi:hypothetical protein
VRLWDTHNTDSKKLSMKKTNGGTTAGHTHLNLRSVADKLRARHEASMLAAADMLRPGPRQNVARLWDTVALLAHDWQSAQDAARIEQRRRRSTDEYVAPLVKTYRKGNSAAAASHALAEEEENRMRALRAAEAEAAARSAAAVQDEDEEYPSLFHPPVRATLSPSSDESDTPAAPAAAASVAPAAAAVAAGAAGGSPPPVTLLPVVGVPSKPFLQMMEALLDSMHQTWKAQQAEKKAMAKKTAAGGGKAAN